jgi:hypothetical protein
MAKPFSFVDGPCTLVTIDGEVVVFKMLGD